jgi:hypothetical protein
MNNIDRIGEYDALKRNLFYHSMNDAPVSKPKTHLSSALEAIESLQARIADLEGGQGEAVAYMLQHEDTGQIIFEDEQQIEWGFLKNNPRYQLIGPLYTRPPSAVPDGWQPSTEVKRSRLYEIAEYLRGLGNDADASHVENCARDMVSMKHEIQTAMRGNKVSIDISTGDDDAGARAFATIIGKQPGIDGSVIWLCELDHYNDDAKPIDSEGGHHD